MPIPVALPSPSGVFFRLEPELLQLTSYLAASARIFSFSPVLWFMG
jgi:hypothetical protein